MKYQKTILLIYFVSFSLQAFSQEMETTLTVNPFLISKYQEMKKNNSKKLPSVLDTIDISVKPFLDDFSKSTIYPDASLWLDSNVFINRDYPIAPPTLGVATFDGVSKSGLPYDTTAGSALSAGADTLTSKPINLSPPSTNIYFSFYWQAMGRGNRPDHYDSLVLEFLNPSLNQWNHIWAREGYIAASPPDSIFHLVMIPITAPAYLQNGFQFRFRNYATVSGNVDHWHIDYVYLDKNRNAGDTIFDDIAFVYNSHSLLKNYYAMPWEQYDSTIDMKTNLDFFIRSNNTTQKFISFDYNIYDNIGGTKASYTGGGGNIDPFLSNGYYNYPPHTNPPIGDNTPAPLIPYSFPALTKDTSFLLECVINTSPDKDRWNDTLRFTQTFNNYYAYDDGTVEAGYGLNVAGGQIAYKFTINKPDVLYAVYMLFNWIGPNVNQQQFKIRVWDDNGGMPGTLKYEDTLTTPAYQYIEHNWANTNMFYPYILKTPQALSGTFYVGWIQYTPETLNVGFDKNTISNSKMFYNIGNGWNQSVLPGSWMIRPVLGDTDGLLNVHTEENSTSAFTVFPNPFSESATLRITNLGELRMEDLKIVNVFGQEVYPEIIRTSDRFVIRRGNLLQGIYFIRITDQTGIIHSQKLILAK